MELDIRNKIEKIGELFYFTCEDGEVLIACNVEELVEKVKKARTKKEIAKIFKQLDETEKEEEKNNLTRRL